MSVAGRPGEPLPPAPSDRDTQAPPGGRGGTACREERGTGAGGPPQDRSIGSPLGRASRRAQAAGASAACRGTGRLMPSTTPHHSVHLMPVAHGRACRSNGSDSVMVAAPGNGRFASSHAFFDAAIPARRRSSSKRRRSGGRRAAGSTLARKHARRIGCECQTAHGPACAAGRPVCGGTGRPHQKVAPRASVHAGWVEIEKCIRRSGLSIAAHRGHATVTAARDGRRSLARRPALARRVTAASDRLALQWCDRR